jgi:hypothetical protein
VVEVTLDPRLAALIPVIAELRALRSYVLSLSSGVASVNGTRGTSNDPVAARPTYWHLIKWIDDALDRMAPHLHSRRWPPVWWRISGMNVDAVTRNIRRADSDGYFRAPEGFSPERDAIMAWVERIDEAYAAAKKVH